MKKFLKKQLREEMLHQRNKLSINEVEEASYLVAEYLTQLVALKVPQVIMAYYPLGQEIDLIFWLQQYQAAGHTILLPRVEGKSLQAVLFTGDRNLKKSKFGVMEPIGEAYPLEKIELVIVPGLAFDYNGYRLGFGQGYYDRFLPLLPACTQCWGVAYQFQIVEDIGHEIHDWQLQKIITNTTII